MMVMEPNGAADAYVLSKGAKAHKASLFDLENPISCKLQRFEVEIVVFYMIVWMYLEEKRGNHMKTNRMTSRKMIWGIVAAVVIVAVGIELFMLLGYAMVTNHPSS